MNRYGLNAPRLDRLQGMHEFMGSKSNHSFAHCVGELSRSMFAHLTFLWNGRVVYRRHWHAFFTDAKDFCLRILASDLYSRLSMALEITELTLGHVHDPIAIVPDPQDPGENSWQLLRGLIVELGGRILLVLTDVTFALGPLVGSFRVLFILCVSVMCRTGAHAWGALLPPLYLHSARVGFGDRFRLAFVLSGVMTASTLYLCLLDAVRDNSQTVSKGS